MNQLLNPTASLEMPNDWSGVKMPTEWDFMPNYSTDWTESMHQQEARHFALWSHEMGQVALDDSVRITMSHGDFALAA